MTRLTFDFGTVLTLEPVDDEGIVSSLVGFPFLFGGDLGREGVEFCFSLGGHGLGGGTDLDAVEI